MFSAFSVDDENLLNKVKESAANEKKSLEPTKPVKLPISPKPKPHKSGPASKVKNNDSSTIGPASKVKKHDSSKFTPKPSFTSSR